jgi:ERF superfamily
MKKDTTLFDVTPTVPADATLKPPSKARRIRRKQEEEVADSAWEQKPVAVIEKLPARASTAAGMMRLISDATALSTVDAAKLRELLDMQKEIIAEEARIAFTRAQVAMKMPTINKDGQIVAEGVSKRTGKAYSQRTRYATLEGLLEVIAPILADHGFVFWSEPELSEDQTRMVVVGHLDHEDGHGKTCRILLPPDPSGSKNPVQGIGSALTYGRRYCLLNLCNIISRAKEDRDTDGRAPVVVDLISPGQAAELRAAIDGWPAIPVETFCAKYGIEKIEQLPAADVRRAMKAVADFKARMGNG